MEGFVQAPSAGGRPRLSQMTLVDISRALSAASRDAALCRAGCLRLQPARVRARAARAVLEPLWRRPERSAAARHESRARSAWRKPACRSATSRWCATGLGSTRRSASRTTSTRNGPCSASSAAARRSAARGSGVGRASASARRSASSQRFFVANYCPLAFMEASGANRTPDKLPAAEQQAAVQRVRRGAARRRAAAAAAHRHRRRRLRRAPRARRARRRGRRHRHDPASEPREPARESRLGADGRAATRRASAYRC